MWSRSRGAVLSVFIESDTVFGLRGPLSAAEPCPRCLLFALTTEPTAVSRLRRGEPATAPVTPVTEQEFTAVCDRLDTASQPAVAAYGRTTGSWLTATSLHNHPACPHDDYPTSSLDARRVDDAADLEAVFLDRSFGLVRRSSAATVSPLAEEFTVAESLAVNPAFYRWPERYARLVPAGGTGASPSMARLRSLMEGLERLSLSRPREVTAAAAETALSKPFVSPSSFYHRRPELPADADSSVAFDPATPIEWTVATELASGDERLVPAGLVYLTPPETTEPVVSTTSSGTAAHFDASDALLAAVFELFERDAVVFRWFEWEPGQEMTHATLPRTARSAVESFEQLGYEVHVLDFTRTEPFYTFVVICLGDGEPSAPTLVAASADADTDAALADALAEATTLYVTAADEVDTIETPDEVETATDHFRYYCSQTGRAALRSFLDGCRPVPYRSVSETVDADRLSEATADVRLYSTTVSPVSLARHGVAVVRAVSPDLVPISFTYGHEWLAHPTDPVTDRRPEPHPHPLS
jgi:thiazole/oxazole-forming peptide maturase SagD family component